MEVILMQDVVHLGDKGDRVQVADGYARNFLIPRKLAIFATPGAIQDLNRRLARMRAKAEREHQENLAKAEAVIALQALTLQANAGEGGRLFGAITTKELARVLEEKTGLEIDRKQLTLDNPIHRVGEYLLTVKFSPKVSATVSIDVLPAEES
jgi:large subunit ribosomal protein L9